MNLTYFRPEMRGNVEKKREPSQHQICPQNMRHQKFIWEHHIWCHVNRASERNSTRGYEDRHRTHLFSCALVETCMASLYSNQNQLSC